MLKIDFQAKSMDVVKLDAVQLYKHQRSNKVVGALVLWVACRSLSLLGDGDMNVKSTNNQKKIYTYKRTLAVTRPR